MSDISLTNLAPTIYAAKDIVARELVGAISSATINSSEVLQASFGDSITSYVSGEPTLEETYTPSMSVVAGAAQEYGETKFALNKVAHVKIPITGETSKKIDNSYGIETVMQSRFAQAIRKIVNTVELHTCRTIRAEASRAFGVAGTNPFATNFEGLADLRQILSDNGTPVDAGQSSLVINTLAGAALRKQGKLTSNADSGSSDLLRRGELLNIYGLSIKESAGVQNVAAGTGTGYSTTNAALTVGQVLVPVSGGTAGATGIVAGDIITIANDTNQYVVKVGVAGAAGTIELQAPGIQKAQTASAKAITLAAANAGNIAFDKSAVEIAMRAPSVPYGGDLAVDRMVITDSVTGLTFDVALYLGRGMNQFEITSFYGVKVWKPEFVAALLG